MLERIERWQVIKMWVFRTLQPLALPQNLTFVHPSGARILYGILYENGGMRKKHALIKIIGE